MSGLTERDLRVLAHYAHHGNRELYWNYLAQLPGNDGYGALALGVVRNDNVAGATANVFAQEVARRKNGIVLIEREWQRFGVDLMRADLQLRTELAENGHARLALNLPVSLVQRAHDRTFRKRDIEVNAWTPRELLEAARHRGGEPAAERLWQTMLDNRSWGLERFKGTIAEMWGQREAPNDMLDYFWRVTQARVAASQVLPYTDPDRIGLRDVHHEYDPARRQWSMVQLLGDDLSGPQRHESPERNAARIAELEDARRLRIERLAMRDDFHPDDRFRRLLRSPQTLAGDDAPPAGPRLAEADDPRRPGHPGHALYRGIEQGVHRLDAERGRAPDAASACMTAALYACAVRSGITSSDHVVLSIDSAATRAGENVFVVQGGLSDARNRVAWMRTDEAVATPVEQSLANAAEYAATREAGAQVLAQAHVQADDAVRQHAPSRSLATP
ncbi:XVIPCD domain-containing protein [Lysobacter sp. N42]|uniref:XVIPCD domain-containing protein n=1 Tax=Lysobacter sp. N42 TaxID=2545719 RepID=UPI0010455503|nr:XVIPCD domain-containing protein [Lysobacter sp. N42]TCZ82819.1 hypothetical protein EYQ95_22475 [Lysobacter sp. N42]